MRLHVGRVLLLAAAAVEGQRRRGGGRNWGTAGGMDSIIIVEICWVFFKKKYDSRCSCCLIIFPRFCGCCWFCAVDTFVAVAAAAAIGGISIAAAAMAAVVAAAAAANITLQKNFFSSLRDRVRPQPWRPLRLPVQPLRAPVLRVPHRPGRPGGEEEVVLH